MDVRIDFFDHLVHDPSCRILELGPLNRPIAEKNKYPNSFTCDIRSTEDVKKLYSGNDYLTATGIYVDPETIVPVDYVAHGSYTETFEGEERFDYVIASHVLEHVDDLLFSLRDIGNLLKPGGIFFVVYPDKRYCFDHFRTSASFRDAYQVYRKGSTENSSMVLDFFFSVIPENDPNVFWENQDLIRDHLPKAPFTYALDRYEQAVRGVRMDDIHYWPFTDMDFLKFLYDCTRAGLLPFRCVDFRPCIRGDQQFMLALSYDPSICSDPLDAEAVLASWMEKALPDYYSGDDVHFQVDHSVISQEIQRLNDLLSRKDQEQKTNVAYIRSLEDAIVQKDREQETNVSFIHSLEEAIAEKEKALDSNALYVRSLENAIVQKDREQETNASYTHSLEEAVAQKEQERDINAAFIRSLEEAVAQKEREQQTNTDFIHSLEEAVAQKEREQQTNIDFIHSLEEAVAQNLSQIEQLSEESRRLSGDRDEQAAQAQSLRQELQACKMSLETAEILAEHHKKRICELEEIEQSWAWRMTKPLRQLASLFKKRS